MIGFEESGDAAVTAETDTIVSDDGTPSTSKYSRPDEANTMNK